MQNLSEASKQGIKIYKVDTLCALKIGLTMTFEHVTWNSMGII